MILLLAADVSPLQDSALYEAACAAVPPARRQKAERFRFDRDKRLCLGAGLLLRHGLAALGADPNEEPFCDRNGKPRLASGLCFNLSHTGQYALCALSGREIGCDAETVQDIDLRLAARFCPEECAEILSEPDPAARRDLFYRYWVLKESFMKATGLGMRLALDAFRILPGDPVTVRQQVDGNTYHFAEFSDLPGCKCALCALERCEGAALQWVSLPGHLSRR